MVELTARRSNDAPQVRTLGQYSFGATLRHKVWEHVSAADWNSWHWQLQNRVQTLGQLRLLGLSESEERAFTACDRIFHTAITPYYASLVQWQNTYCPIRLQSVPQPDELLRAPTDMHDPLGEEKDMVVPGLTHRYPDRVLLYVTHNCAMYCRHCMRKRKVGDPTSASTAEDFAAAFDYIRRNPQIRDVLLSGGDPLSLSDNRLVELCRQLRSIPHVEIIRLCTRNLVTLPQRLTPDLLQALAPYGPIYIMTHFNHPRECTLEALEAAERCANAGFPVLNQMVLLAGINDQVSVVRELNHRLLLMRIRPYYILQADLAAGISHFRTSVYDGLRIMKELRGHTSGLAVPHYIMDAPGGGGKISLQPDYIESMTDEEVVFRNFRGDIYRYPNRPVSSQVT